MRRPTRPHYRRILSSGESDRNMTEERDLLRDIPLDGRGVARKVLEEVISLAVEIAREGREGHKVGTMFVVGDAEETMKHSTGMILDPLWGHPREVKHISDPNLRETVKELAQLDGAFIVDEDGTVLSAGRYINANSEGLHIPLGLGARHMAAASITRDTNAIAVVVSESSIVRVFDDAEIIAEIVPELWLIRHGRLHIQAPYSVRAGEQITVASKARPTPEKEKERA